MSRIILLVSSEMKDKTNVGHWLCKRVQLKKPQFNLELFNVDNIFLDLKKYFYFLNRSFFDHLV
jgi:hypothetical protein